MAFHVRATAGATLFLTLCAVPIALLAKEEDPDVAIFKAISESETMLMVPMRDGVGLATDVYLPKVSAVHAQSEHGRQRLRRDGGRGRAQHAASLRRVSFADRPARAKMSEYAVLRFADRPAIRKGKEL
jgi:predicted acyl esterase